MAATSLSDHLWAVTFLLAGIDALQRRRPVQAGVWWGLAIGTRMATVVLVVAAVVADAIGQRRSARPSRPAITAGAVALLVGAACFIPPWLSVGRTTDFLRRQFDYEGLTSLVGGWLVKNEIFLGVPAWLVVLVALPVLVAALRQWKALDGGSVRHPGGHWG